VYADGTKEVRHKTADVWKDGARKTVQFETTPGKTLKKVTLGGKTIPDSKQKDNTWEQK